MKKFGLILLGALGAALVFVFMSGSEADTPRLTVDGRALSPSCTIVVTKDQLRSWPISPDKLVLYEYAKGPAVVKIEDKWYALNGLAANWAKKEQIKEGTQLHSIRLLEQLPTPGAASGAAQRSLGYLLELNDQVNKRCPS